MPDLLSAKTHQNNLFIVGEGVTRLIVSTLNTPLPVKQEIHVKQTFLTMKSCVLTAPNYFVYDILNNTEKKVPIERNFESLSLNHLLLFCNKIWNAILISLFHLLSSEAQQF